MKQWMQALIVVSGFFLASCGELPVSTDFDTSRDLSGLKTYAWMEPKAKLILDPLVDNDLMNRRVQRAVEAQLLAQGFTKATSNDAADFLITYHISAETKISVTNFHSRYGYYPYGYGPAYGPGFGYGFDNDVIVNQYKQGTFMLDIIDPASSSLIWRGVAGKRLNEGTPEQRDAYVREIVNAILLKFSPAATTAAP